MGFYDDSGWNYPPRPPKKTGYFLSGMIGAIIGGLIVFAALLLLYRNGILPVGDRKEDILLPREKMETENQGTIVRNVSLDVETDITKAVEKVSDAVVGITNYSSGNFWLENEAIGTGSGVIYRKANGKAYIVTNHHVIEGANQLEVTLHDGTKLEARLLGSDVWTDLAVLEVDGSKVNKVAEFGDSDTLKLGEPVIAIGNPLGQEFAGSVTLGIISGLERTVPIDLNEDGNADWNAEVLQTDAAINPGNSGGALVNISGQVIGINSMKIAQEEVEGIGFSIPINIAIPVIEDLERYGEVKRPYMGVSLQELSQIPEYHLRQTLKLPENISAGLLVTDVVSGSPADRAGLRQMDVIVRLDDQKIETMIDLRKYLYNSKEIGDTLTVGYYRNGKYQEVKLTLAEGKS